MVVFNYEPEDVIERIHIAYFTKPLPEYKIALYEVIEVKIKHPQAPEHATVSTIETHMIKTLNRTSFDAGNVILIEASQNACRKDMTS